MAQRLHHKERTEKLAGSLSMPPEKEVHGTEVFLHRKPGKRLSILVRDCSDGLNEDDVLPKLLTIPHPVKNSRNAETQ